jgi:hypothetical protein
MFIFRCTSCQHEQRFDTINVPPSQCNKCGGPVSMLRDTEPPPPEASEPAGSFATARLAALRGEPTGNEAIFVSTMVYQLGRELGAANALAEFTRQLEAASKGEPEPEALPVVRAIARLRGMFEVVLHVDCGATSIGRARSRAFHNFVKSGCSTWVSIDDDVEADASTLAALVEAVEGSTSICIGPCLLRETARVNVMLDRLREARELPSGARVIGALAGGFGLVAMSRSAAARFATRYAKSLRWVDSDKQAKVAIFHELLVEGQLYGEDMAFFARTPPGVRVEALATGRTVHAGLELELEGFETGRTLLQIGENELDEQTPMPAPGGPAGELPAPGDLPAVVEGPALNSEQQGLLQQFLAGAAGQGVQPDGQQGDAGQAPLAAEEAGEGAPTG